MLRFLLWIAAAAACAAQPHIVNARLETRSAAAGLEREFRSILNSASAPAWIGYSVPAIDGERPCCSRCSLEDERSRTEPRPPGSTGPARIAVLIRVEQRKTTRVRVYSEDCELDARGLPVYWLADVRPAESVNLLVPFVTGTDGRLCDSAMMAIALHDDPAADEMMDRFVAPSQSEAIREKATFWLGAARGKRGYEVLRRVVRGDASAAIREKAVFALSINKTPEAADAIIDTARNDRSARVRGQALFWLAQKAGKKAEAAITSAIANDPETEVKKQAVFALTQLPKDESVPLLIQTARTNRNPAVREQAMFWLGQSQDPRALSFFEEILKR